MYWTSYKWEVLIMVYGAVKKLVQYGLDTGLITEVDRIYATNQILDVLKLDDYEDTDISGEEIGLEQVLEELMDYAHVTGVLPEDSVTYRDLFDTRLMNCLMPRPSEVVDKFWRHYENSPVEATDYFYKPGLQLHPQIPCLQGLKMESRDQVW